MYVPRHFAVDDRARIDELVQSYPLALLVTVLDGEIEATHVPVVFDPGRGPHGAARFHLAGANPTARALDGARDAMLVFTGPQAYVSPDWYENEHLVPTWNYAAVHVWGKPVPMEDGPLRRLLDDLSALQENQIPGKRPWTSDKLPGDLYAKMRRAIIGFDMTIDRIDAKWKMSQNRGPRDRAGVVSALTVLGGDQKRAVAETMSSLESD